MIENIRLQAAKVKAVERKKLYLFAGIGVVLAAAAVIGLISRHPAHEQAVRTDEPIEVTAMTVEPRMVDAVVTAVGALNSKNVSVLSSKIMGTVTSLNVHEGDYVTRGMLLAKIESGEISAQLYQAQAAYNNARLQYDRIKGLYDAQASTQMEMDQATLGLGTAEAGLKAARAMESYTTITAPISGQIVEKKINLGEMAMPGQPLLRIEDNRNLRLEVTVKEQDIRYISSGKSVRVAIDAMPGKEIKGTVAQVVPASDVRTHSFVVKVDVPAEKGLITGMYGRAFFPTEKREAIVVPRAAVVEMGGLSGVHLVSAVGNAVFQMVQLGEERGDGVEVLTGLKRGDHVIISRQEGPIDGRKVFFAENGK